MGCIVSAALGGIGIPKITTLGKWSNKNFKASWKDEAWTKHSKILMSDTKNKYWDLIKMEAQFIHGKWLKNPTRLINTPKTQQYTLN